MRQPHHDGGLHSRGDAAHHLADLLRSDADILQLGADRGEAAQLQRIGAQPLHPAGKIAQLRRRGAANIANEEGITLVQAFRLLLHLLQRLGAVQGGIINLPLPIKDARADHMAFFQRDGFCNNGSGSRINGLLHCRGITAPGTGCRYDGIFERQAHKIDR